MPPRVHHFIMRPEVVRRLPTGLAVEQSLVPLVALDELPEWLDVLGVPRSLAPEQAAGLSNLGCYERQGVHDVEIVIDESESDAAGDANDASGTTGAVRGGGQKPALGDEKPQQQPGLQQSRWADRANNHDGTPGGRPEAVTSTTVHPTDGMAPPHIASPPSPATTASAPRHPAMAASAPPNPRQISPSLPAPPHNNQSAAVPDRTRQQPRSGRPPTPPTTPPRAEAAKHRRAYCRHWIRHGTCKWGPDCRFAHAMPATLSGLAEAGLSEFPGWWTAAVGLALASPPQPPLQRREVVEDYARMAGGPAVAHRYGMPGFLSYAPAGSGGQGGYAGYGGYARGERAGGEREIRPRETERWARKMGVEERMAGVVGTPGMKTMGDVGGAAQYASPGGRGQAPSVARASLASETAVFTQGPVASVTVGGGREIRAGPEQQVRQEVPVQQKLVDV